MNVNRDGENLNQPVDVVPAVEPANQPVPPDAGSDVEVSPPPVPPESESGDSPEPQPIAQQPPNETLPETTEQQTNQASEVEEEKPEREEVLTDLIDEFANISEENLKQYDAFREKTQGEKIKSALKGFGRRAAVYAAFGVGAYAFLHLAPVAVVAGAAAGLGGSTLSRGVIDMVKWASGAEKKEQALKSQISEKQMEKLRSLTALATNVKQIEDMPGQQAINPENNQIVTLEEAKFNFVEALVDFNDKTAEENPEIEGLKKKYEKSRKRWRTAKTVASIVGGVAAGGVVTAEFKELIANRIAEQGFTMHGQGLGEIAPQAAHEHLVQLHHGEVVFNYKPGELDMITNAIKAKPELAQIFATTQHTRDLIAGGMHQAGEQLSQRFLESVNEIANARIAEFVVGAAATAEAADRVWKAISPERSEEEKYLDQSSKYGKENLEQFRGDLKAVMSARQNERFQAIFSEFVPENLPEVGQTVSVRSRFELKVPQPDGSEKQLIVAPGDNLLIHGVDQNGNISVTHIEQNELLTLTREDFYQNVLAPIVTEARAGEAVEGGEQPAEQRKAEEEERPEFKKDEFYLATKLRKQTGQEKTFIADINGEKVYLIINNISPENNPLDGENWIVQVENSKIYPNGPIELEVRADRKQGEVEKKSEVSAATTSTKEITEEEKKERRKQKRQLMENVEKAFDEKSPWRPVKKTNKEGEVHYDIKALDEIYPDQEKWIELNPQSEYHVLMIYKDDKGRHIVRFYEKGATGQELSADINEFIRALELGAIADTEDPGLVNDAARTLFWRIGKGKYPLSAAPAAPPKEPAKPQGPPTEPVPPAQPALEPTVTPPAPEPEAPPEIKSYTFSKEGEMPIEIKAGQKWRLRKDNWDTGQEFSILDIEPTEDGNNLKVTFDDTPPRTESIEAWDQVFRRAELIE